jgi:hypothetical protein
MGHLTVAIELQTVDTDTYYSSILVIQDSTEVN